MRLPLRSSIAIVAVFVFAGSQTSCSNTSSAKVPSVEPLESPAVVVPAGRVARSAIASKTLLTAEFQPFQEVDVMAKVAGYVRTIKVDLGDRVREG
ncbi:MAG TPA: efflux RND transporter periplasmic adaptor subunit, partial [Bryobacteraceae bacterium]|nr:efflux RND transporter periplasmic adaptor subunit [Bryobacteraceae bacterium]